MLYLIAIKIVRKIPQTTIQLIPIVIAVAISGTIHT